MSTIELSAASPELRERTFFMAMAVAIAATVAMGFGSWFLTGHSTFQSPWWVHVHAVSFVSWIALYVTQNLFVYRDTLVNHRKLGRIGVVLAVWMVLVGSLATAGSVITDRVPPFFTPPFFLALDWVNIASFAGLVGAGIAMRRQTDWHRRLMFCATVCVISPGIARALLLTEAMSPVTMSVALLSFIVAGVLFDVWNRRRLHPAYMIGAIVLFLMGPVTGLLSELPIMHSIAESLAG